MPNLQAIVTEVSSDCAEEYRQRMRARLMQQPHAWLVDQLLAHVADLSLEPDVAAAPEAVEPLQVEYGETASEVVGHGVAAALRVINDLEINEQALYARMENIEESTLP